jgi:Flp pilus assembly protein TadD
MAYEHALGIKKDDLDTLVNLGRAARRAGDAKRAVEVLRRAVTRGPKDAEAHYLLGATLAEGGQAEAGAAEVRASLAIDPAQTVAWRRLASIELGRGQCSDARAAFDRYFKLVPKAPRAKEDAAVKACLAK